MRTECHGAVFPRRCNAAGYLSRLARMRSWSSSYFSIFCARVNRIICGTRKFKNSSCIWRSRVDPLFPHAVHRRIAPVGRSQAREGHARALRWPVPLSVVSAFGALFPDATTSFDSQDGPGSRSAPRTRSLDGSIWRHRCSRAALGRQCIGCMTEARAGGRRRVSQRGNGKRPFVAPWEAPRA